MPQLDASFDVELIESQREEELSVPLLPSSQRAYEVSNQSVHTSSICVGSWRCSSAIQGSQYITAPMHI
jgi:hypothetical protein